jgi:hypothetical protein
MKKNMKSIIISIILPIILTALYVGDYFLVETYKSVPVYHMHLFGTDLASYRLFEHVSSSIIFGILLIVLLSFIVYYWVAVNKKKK